MFVVEDDPLAGRALADVLAREGQLEVTAFTSAQGALDAAQLAPPDLAVIGLRVSGRRGADLIRELEAIDPQMASMLITSASDTDSTVEAQSLVGPLRCVHKPVVPSDLLPKLRAQLERRQLICDLQAMAATLELSLIHI